MARLCRRCRLYRRGLPALRRLFGSCGTEDARTALTIGAILTYIAAELILLTLGIAPILYLPELVAFLYLWIAYFFLSRPQLVGNRVLGYLFAIRGAVNLPWFWEFTHSLIPYSNVIDQILIVSIGWALVLTELFRATEQNSRLYRDLKEREAKIRRLVDANIIGIVIWKLDGQILRRKRRLSAHRWIRPQGPALGPSESEAPHSAGMGGPNEQSVQDVRMTGTALPFEKEYFRKDGSRVSAMMGSASFEEGGNQGVAFVLDLTEQKRAEAEARESERRYARRRCSRRT